MNWQDFPAGKRVVCLLDFRGEIAAMSGKIDIVSGSLPSKGEICTVRGTDADDFNGALLLHLVEYDTPQAVWHCPHGHAHPIRIAFEAEHFRPVDESKLDQFRVHLKDAPVDAPREAVPA